MLQTGSNVYFNIYVRILDQPVINMRPDKIMRPQETKTKRRGQRKKVTDDGKSLGRSNNPSILEKVKRNSVVACVFLAPGLVFWPAHPTLIPAGPWFRCPPRSNATASLYNQPRLLSPRLLGTTIQ